MPSKKTKEKKERKYPPFEKAVKLVELCANERIFHPQNDCDYCPVRAECLDVWNDNLSSSDKQFTLGRFIECFEKIQKAKSKR